MRVAIVGCGYTGQVLARRLIERGNPVRATTTSETRLSQLAALGAEPTLLRTDRPETLAAGLEGAEAVVHLAPPDADPDPRRLAETFARAVSPSLRVFVYGSTTGVFGDHGEAWVDEDTPPNAPHARGLRRLATEEALRQVGLPLKVVRIAGIYGPGRTMRSAIEREALILVEGAPSTSRIHVEDLARLLEAMLNPEAPALAIACDEEPAPTIDVARYTCELLGLEPPAPVTLEEARRVLSSTAQEMRLGGHRCRSKVRARLVGDLRYPTYREGVKASLEMEGTLRKGAKSVDKPGGSG